jgi:hypothetical protein
MSATSRAISSVSDLGEEAVAAERRAEVRMQHLDGDIALVTEVVREVDNPDRVRARCGSGRRGRT